MQHRIFILGAPNAGKKTVLKAISREDVEFLCYDYEEIVIKKQVDYLLRPSVGNQLSLVDEVLDEKIDGIILVINNKNGLQEPDKGIVSLIEEKSIPYIIFANKQDIKSGNLVSNPGTLVIPTISTQNIGVNDGLNLLLGMIEQHEPGVEQTQKSVRYESVQRNAGSKFCEVKILVRPVELENVKQALEEEGFSNITVTYLRYIENTGEHETYRSYTHASEYPEKVEIMTVTLRENITYIRSALTRIKTADIDNELIINPIENVIRIRTREEGENAIE